MAFHACILVRESLADPMDLNLLFKDKIMPRFMKGQNPVAGLSGLKKFMEEKIAMAEESSNLQAKLQFLEDAHQEHFEKMGSLTTIYKGGSAKVDELKTQIRALYEQMLDLKQQCKDEIQSEKAKQESVQKSSKELNYWSFYNQSSCPSSEESEEACELSDSDTLTSSF